jgi:hypothetical protein
MVELDNQTVGMTKLFRLGVQLLMEKHHSRPNFTGDGRRHDYDVKKSRSSVKKNS